jgi:hypothetical protein
MRLKTRISKRLYQFNQSSNIGPPRLFRLQGYFPINDQKDLFLGFGFARRSASERIRAVQVPDRGAGPLAAIHSCLAVWLRTTWD